MTTLACFLEEPSAREMLKGVLPRLFPVGVNFKYIVFDGKQDLEKQLPAKLRNWQLPDSLFLVIRDQDSADCKKVKEKLVDICKCAGKPHALVRIACHELESFYLGDLAAVEKGLGLANIARLQVKAKYRFPDKTANPCNELEKLTNHTYQNVMGSRKIAPFLALTDNKSHSFNKLVTGLQSLINNRAIGGLE